MEKTFVSRYIVDRNQGQTVAWGSVFAGVVTFIALSLLFTLIGAAIGLGGIHPQQADPTGGVGTGLVIWTIVSFIISLACAGYVAGVTAARAGFIHGFLVWALGMITAVALTTTAIGGAFHAVGQIFGTTTDAIGSATSQVGDAIGSLSQSAFDAVSDELSVDFDSEDISDEVVQALEDSDIPELQPDYLQGQLDAVTEEVKTAGSDILIDGKDPQEVIDQLSADIKDRITNIYDQVDEDDLRHAIAENTDLTEREADQAIENVKDAYSQASKEAKEKLDEAQDKLADLEEEATAKLHEAEVTADEVTDVSAKYAVYLFIGLVLAALVAAFAGYAGSNTAQQTLNL